MNDGVAVNMTALDPFNLRELARDTNKRLVGIMMHDYEQVVPETELVAVKKKLGEAAAPLTIEFMNDVGDLELRLAPVKFIDDAQFLPGPSEMAEGFADVFFADPSDDPIVSQRQALRRVKWTFDVWLQITASLLKNVSGDFPPEIITQINEGSGEKSVRIPRPQVLETFAKGAFMVERVTCEYLEAKADLLRVHGVSVPHIEVTSDRGKAKTLNEAREALWADQVSTPHLVLQSLRSALIDALQLRHYLTSDMAFRKIHTSDLVRLADLAGLPLPFPSQLLYDIASHVEEAYSRCDMISVNRLYPFARIFLYVTEHVMSLPADASMGSRAVEFLRQPSPANTPASEARSEEQNA